MRARVSNRGLVWAASLCSQRRARRGGGRSRRFHFCIERLQSVRRLFLQLRNFVIPAARRPEARTVGRVPDLVGSRLPSPYHFRARIQSFQAVAVPFRGGRPSKRSPMSTKRSRGCERRRRNKDRPPSFLARISKSKLFLSKLLQTILWWFCVISKGYKTSKPHSAVSKFFRLCRLLSAAFSMPPDRIPSLRAVWARACPAIRRRLCCRRVKGAFMVEDRSG